MTDHNKSHSVTDAVTPLYERLGHLERDVASLGAESEATRRVLSEIQSSIESLRADTRPDTKYALSMGATILGLAIAWSTLNSAPLEKAIRVNSEQIHGVQVEMRTRAELTYSAPHRIESLDKAQDASTARIERLEQKLFLQGAER